MQALEDFRDLRCRLVSATTSRDTMHNHTLHQVRRDLAAQAYAKSCDQIVDLLVRLTVQPILAGEAAQPVMAVLEDALAAIAQAEAAHGGTA